MDPRKTVNELEPELLSVHALNFAAAHNSSNRAMMFSQHFAQRLVIEGADEKRIQTGIEREFGKYTFSVKMPENGQILKVIPRYPQGVHLDALPFNPETIIIYENDETGQIDYFSVPYYCSYHQFFGFKYDFKQSISKLRPGAFIPKDTIFADSPAVAENSGYKYGINLNVAFMSVPSVSEDGIMISRDVLEKLKFRIYERRTVEFGSSQFPLNLYGTADKYKPFPEIGDYIREDGILMMLRSYENDLMPVEMSVYDAMEPDFIFDKAVYVRGGPDITKEAGSVLGKGRVVDIKVFKNNNPNRQLPEAMSEFIGKYEKALLSFHRELVSFEEKLRIDRKKKFGESKPNLSPKLHRLIVESLAITNHNPAKFKHNLGLLYRKAPIDEYRIEFVVEYEMIPTVGFKLTDCHGGKGVICKIEEPENMPVDADGNRADLVTDSASVIARMNLGRLYEHYLNSAIVHVHKQLCQILGLAPSKEKRVERSRFDMIDKSVVEHAYQHLLHFYQHLSERQYAFYRDQITDEEKQDHLYDVVNNGIYAFCPINTEKDSVEMIKSIEKTFKPTYGPVSYVGDSGQRMTTKNNVRVAPLYMMLLDKIADDWSSVSSGKLQHFGVLSPMTKSEKFMYPYRNSPVRTIGETEGRIFAGYCGREAIAEMMDRSNSPLTQRNIHYNILSAPKPGDIKFAVDRDYIPLGNSRPLQLVRHVMSAAGFLPVYEPEDPSNSEE